MSKEMVIAILEEYNQWRNGAETPMIKPELITKAIDSAIRIIKGKTK